MDNRTTIRLIQQMIAQMRPPGAMDLKRDRARYDSAASAFSRYIKTSVSELTLNGVHCEVHVPPQNGRAGCLLYFHGGAYALGSAMSHRHLAAEIARLTECTVVVPDYALSPEHPFPAGLQDGAAVYEAVAERWADLPIVLAGDSAGGALAVSTALQVRGKDNDRVRAVVCFSPWMDLTCSTRLYEEGTKHDGSLDAHRLRTYAQQYLGACIPRDPLASPLFASLVDLPPTLVQVGRDEILHEDSILFARRAEQAGADVVLEVWDDVVHVWQWYWPILESGSAALAKIANFLRNRLMPDA